MFDEGTTTHGSSFPSIGAPRGCATDPGTAVAILIWQFPDAATRVATSRCGASLEIGAWGRWRRGGLPPVALCLCLQLPLTRNARDLCWIWLEAGWLVREFMSVNGVVGLGLVGLLAACLPRPGAKVADMLAGKCFLDAAMCGENGRKVSAARQVIGVQVFVPVFSVIEAVILVFFKKNWLLYYY